MRTFLLDDRLLITFQVSLTKNGGIKLFNMKEQKGQVKDLVTLAG